MKFALFFILLSICNSFASSHAQNGKLSVKVQQATIDEIISIIENQSDYVFFYKNNEIDNTIRYNVNLKNGNIHKIMDQWVENTSLSYKISGNYIFLEKTEIKNTPENVVMQPKKKQITGTVNDKNGEPIIGANIIEKGTANGTTTDIDGQFSLSVEENAILQVSYIGYQTQEISAEGNSHLIIVLNEDRQALEEIVVVGYGTQKKTSLTAAVSTLKGEDIAIVPSTSVANTLGGRMSGVIVRQTTGEPGRDESSIYIRGIATTGSTAPLVIVNNIPRSFSNLNPNDIESISILKDAAAVAAYGMAGANGVILVTTKKGQKGRAKVSYNGYVGFQNPSVLPDVVNAYEFATLKNVAAINTGLDAPYSEAELQKFKDGSDPDLYANSNVWKENLDKNTIRTSHSVQVSGGGEAVTYYLSFGYFHQDGLWSTNYSNRYNVAVDLNVQPSKHTTLNFNMKASELQRHFPGIEGQDNRGTARIFELLKYDFPTKPNKFSNGLYASYSGPSIYESGYLKNKQRDVFLQLSLTQDIPFISGLTLKGTMAYDPTSVFDKLWYTPTAFWSITDATTMPYTYTKSILGLTKPMLSESMQNNYRITVQGGFDYAKDFKSNHIKAMALFETTDYKYNTLGAQRYNYNLTVDELNMGSPNQADGSNNGTSSRNRLVGGVFRVNYDYDYKYLVEVSGRYDGSYYFAKGKKFGFFPSVSLGYRLSEESFMNIPWLNNLKIRGSYGEVGALAGAAYQYMNTYSVTGTGAALGGALVQATNERSEPNPNITWERARKTNVGIDLGIFNSLLALEVDYFHEKRSNMLVNPNVVVPSEYGIGISQVNDGKMKNSGIDLALKVNHRVSNDLFFQLTGTYTYAKSKLLKVYESPTTYNNPNRRQTGRPLGTQFGYKSLGYFQVEDFDADGNLNPGIATQPWGTVYPGDIRYEDINGDGKINEDDITVIGDSWVPKHVYGFGGNIDYKNFSFSFLFQGAAGMDLFKTRDSAWPFDNGMGALKENLDYWTPENRNALNPRVTPAPTTNNTQTSSHWMKSSDYLRLKNATLSYTIPSLITQKAYMEHVSIFFSGENLLTFTKFTNYDPENTESMGRGFPVLKVITIGANITF